VSVAGAKHNARIGGTGDTPLDQAQKGQEQAREAGGEAAVEQAGHNEVIWLLKHPKEAKKLPPPEMEAPPQPAAFEAGVGTVRDAGDAVQKRLFRRHSIQNPPNICQDRLGTNIVPEGLNKRHVSPGRQGSRSGARGSRLRAADVRLQIPRLGGSEWSPCSALENAPVRGARR
jgi:hypothetical protein